MKKLTELQNELHAPKNQYNKFGKYKYRSCEDILEALKPLLLKYDLSLTLTDEIKETCGVPYVDAMATLTDNADPNAEEIRVCAQAGIEFQRAGMDYAQSFGASSSYARKYCLNALFLIDDTKDPDGTNDHDKSKPKQKPTMTDETYEKALPHVLSGKFTIEQVQAKYFVAESYINKFEKALAEVQQVEQVEEGDVNEAERQASVEQPEIQAGNIPYEAPKEEAPSEAPKTKATTKTTKTTKSTTKTTKKKAEPKVEKVEEAQVVGEKSGFDKVAERVESYTSTEALLKDKKVIELDIKLEKLNANEAGAIKELCNTKYNQLKEAGL